MFLLAFRKYGPQCGLPVGSVADDEESKAVIRTILERRLQLSQTLGNATNSDGSDLNGRPSDQGRATAGEAAGPSGSSTPADNKDLRGQAAYYRKCISNMKNFVTTTHRCVG